MTIMLELKPDLEAIARTEAQAQGISVEEYMQIVLERTLVNQHSNPLLAARLHALYTLGIPAAIMSDYATGRESLYDV